jgi:DNA-binding NtrC family response regulator
MAEAMMAKPDATVSEDAADAASGDAAAWRFDRLPAESPAARAALALARRAAATDVTVLFEGESGVGKEVFARALHAASARASGPFVAVNCGALPEALIESILFGHERGAFTGAVERRPGKFVEADGGTLFLDEIGELPPAAQVKLLRAVQEREVEPVGGAGPRRVNIRLLAATNRDLRVEALAGRFREDLFYRVCAFPVRIPALRERPEDVAPLARRLLAAICAAEGAAPPPIAPEALAALRARPWPGNVRELRNALDRARILSGGGPILAEHVADHAPAPARREPAADLSPAPAPAAPQGAGAVRPLAEVEADHIRFALTACGGNLAETARRLEISRSTLYRKMTEMGLNPNR